MVIERMSFLVRSARSLSFPLEKIVSSSSPTFKNNPHLELGAELAASLGFPDDYEKRLSFC
jgi:hypothetical protein